MMRILFFAHIFFSVCLVVLVLLQKGSGVTNNQIGNFTTLKDLFGTHSVNRFLLKLSVIFSIFFFFTSIFIGSYISIRINVEVDDTAMYTEMFVNKNCCLDVLSVVKTSNTVSTTDMVKLVDTLS